MAEQGPAPQGGGIGRFIVTMILIGGIALGGVYIYSNYITGSADSRQSVGEFIGDIPSKVSNTVSGFTDNLGLGGGGTDSDLDVIIDEPDEQTTTPPEQEPPTDNTAIQPPIDDVTKDVQQAVDDNTQAVTDAVDAVTDTDSGSSKKNWLWLLLLLPIGIAVFALMKRKKKKPEKPKEPNPKYDPTPPDKPVTNDPPSPVQPGENPYKPETPPPDPSKHLKYDLTKWFPAVKNQGNIGACSAFAGAAMFEYVYNTTKGVKGAKSDLDVSELFLYYNGRLGVQSDSGCYYVNICKTIINEGICKEETWDYRGYNSPYSEGNISVNHKFLARPPQNAFDEALDFRAVKYSFVTEGDADLMVHALKENHPLHISVYCPHNFGGIRADYYDAVDPAKLGGGHAMVIVGYDSQYKNPAGNKVEAFKIRNSWGSGWGNGGYVWVEKSALLSIMAGRGPPRVIEGWNKTEHKKNRFQINGRVIFDDSESVQEQTDLFNHTGRELYGEDNLFREFKDHSFKVGVLAQVDGKLVDVATPITVSGDGVFEIGFKEQEIEPLTNLPEDLAFLAHTQTPIKGYIVYKEGPDKIRYYHTVQSSYSRFGRGGQRGNNPRSKGSHSGIPITFDSKHQMENYVIVPVYPKTELPKSKDELVKLKQLHSMSEKMLTHLHDIRLKFTKKNKALKKETPKDEKIFTLKKDDLAWIFSAENKKHAKSLKKTLEIITLTIQAQFNQVMEELVLEKHEKDLFDALQSEDSSLRDFISKEVFEILNHVTTILDLLKGILTQQHAGIKNWNKELDALIEAQNGEKELDKHVEEKFENYLSELFIEFEKEYAIEHDLPETFDKMGLAIAHLAKLIGHHKKVSEPKVIKLNPEQ